MRFAVDTGGTFTDLVIEDSKGKLYIFKSPTTPENPVEGILSAFDKASENFSISTFDLLSKGEFLLHGTTRATNAIVTSGTAKTAFLTTLGHPDILVLREGGRTDPFNFSVPFPQPYIPRSLTFEVKERISAQGKIITPLDKNSLIKIINHMKKKEIESIAVCLLWSTVNPIHEKKIGNLLDTQLPKIPFTLSHELNPVLREYRRASSACIDASLKPLMTEYILNLQDNLKERGFQGRLLMLTSKGGVMDYKEIAEAPIHTVGSGPAMAPIAGRYFAKIDSKSSTAIIADTGGTTYDVSLVRNGEIPMTPETWLGDKYQGNILGFSSVDVKSIGAGGGSIAWVDEGGLLHVGPKSAGANPGPACYGKGGVFPTVTDACLILGYIDADYFLGGKMKLDLIKARKSINKYICKPLNLKLNEGAQAILHLATENMVSAIEEITIHQGIDPRNSVLIGGGGAAGLNSVAIARRLNCKELIIPETGSVLSATGAIMSELHADFRALFFTSSNNFNFKGVEQTLKKLKMKAEKFIKGTRENHLDYKIEFWVEARYKSQVWEIDLPITKNLLKTKQSVEKFRKDFDKSHENIFAFSDPDSPIEFIGWRSTVNCKIRSKPIGKIKKNKFYKHHISKKRKAFFDKKGLLNVPVIILENIKKNHTVKGPAIIESPFTTIVLDIGSKATRTKRGSLKINI
jgi:N-methylhydantoinase A